jgi:hypothetical protein
VAGETLPLLKGVKMFVNTNQIQVGLTNFIEAEIGAKATGIQKFGTYFMLPIINNKVVNFVNSFKDNEFTKDFFNSNGDIDLDALYNMSKQAIQKSGQFAVAGIIFNESDIDKLYSYIRSTKI